MVALVLALLYGAEDPGRIPGLEPELLALVLMEFFDSSPTGVSPRPHGLGRDVLVGRRVFGDAVDVQPALVGEGAAPHVGTMRTGVRFMSSETPETSVSRRNLSSSMTSSPILSCKLAIVVTRSQLHRLPDTVDGALYVRRPGL